MMDRVHDFVPLQQIEEEITLGIEFRNTVDLFLQMQYSKLLICLICAFNEY